MKFNVPMPSLGPDMDYGRLMKWKIRPGEEVKKGQIIAVVETTKSAVEIESYRDGMVLDLLGKEGEEIHVGSPIAIFEVPDQLENINPEQRQKISPAAKKFAVEHQIDLSELKKQGLEEKIELKDLKDHLSEKDKSTSHDMSRINLGKAIARVMARSKKEIPHYYLKTRILLDPLMKWIDEKNKKLPPDERLMVPVILMRGIILAVKRYPALNGHYIDEKFIPQNDVNLGVATALKGGGVMAPAIMKANLLSLEELNHSFQDLLVRTKRGELKNQELSEGTLTVTNVGDLGIDEVFGIIYPPQVALVGIGRIHKSVVQLEGVIRPAFVVDVTLSADHRASNGLLGSSFLASLENLLLNPTLLEEQDDSRRSESCSQEDLFRDSTGD
jgi:pyruvate dehydrogenase E2 component (dihydrolipoamide acetyltransferase)